MIDFISNLMKNWCLMDLTANDNDLMNIFLIMLGINCAILLIYELWDEDNHHLTSILIKIGYVIFHFLFHFLIAFTLVVLLGDIGAIIYVILFIVSSVWSIFIIEDNVPYIFGFGNFAETMSDNLYSKQNYYKDLKHSYKNFINDNKNII